MKKIAFVSSGGGHLEEIAKFKRIGQSYDSFLVTEKSDIEVNDFCERKYYISRINQPKILFLPKFLHTLVYAVYLLKKEKPDFVVTTGGLIAYPFCLVAKFLNIKTIYLESYACVSSPSLTGKLLYNIADLFVVQWADMLQNYPRAVLACNAI